MGAAYAATAAEMGAGVVVNDVDGEAAEAVAASIRATGGKAIAAVRDISDPQEAAAVVQACIAEFGAITGLVNNAAIQTEGLFEQTTIDQLRLVLNVNVVGLYNMTRAAIEPMLAQRRGSIVNITSGAHTGQPRISLYGATKGAVASLTYGIAGEVQGRGVRVNAVSPMACTQMSGYDPKLPTPAANCPPVMFLLSDRSAAINGQVIRITGPKLSLMCHPAIRAPILESECWTPESVAQAFETTFAANLLPTNVAVYDISSVRMDISPAQM